MVKSVYDLKDFYSHRGGRLVRRLVAGHIGDIWPESKGLRVMGHGYAIPYLRPYLEGSERVFNVMPSEMGVHHWPSAEENLVCLADDEELPLETESVDRILMLHSLEYSKNPERLLQELWRVMKSNGRLLLVVPNRLGMWARADWTPFGHGRPYSAGQIHSFLQDNCFVHERTEKALFMPPFRSFLVLRSAYFFEGFGRYIFPGLAGLCIVEASKQIYAGAVKGKRARSGPERILVPKAAMNPR